jgi:hypothetical protein
MVGEMLMMRLGLREFAFALVCSKKKVIGKAELMDFTITILPELRKRRKSRGEDVMDGNRRRFSSSLGG